MPMFARVLRYMLKMEVTYPSAASLNRRAQSEYPSTDGVPVIAVRSTEARDAVCARGSWAASPSSSTPTERGPKPATLGSINPGYRIARSGTSG